MFCVQCCSCPARHGPHSRQESTRQPTPARSPTANFATSGPTAETVPAISCPGTSGCSVPVADFMAGAHLYGGILSALVGRARTGRGRVVEVSMLEALCTRAEITAACQEAQVAMAFVVTADDTLTPAGLAQALRGTVASFAVPSRWYLQREPLPTNDTHKVDKQALLALVRATGAGSVT